MNLIAPYSSQYLVPSIDLVKYGQPILNEGIRKASGTLKVPFAPTSSQFPEQLVPIISANEVRDVVEIFYRKKVKGGLSVLKTSIDKATGYFVDKNDGFEFIAHFDPRTFNEDLKSNLSNVGYWTLHNQYIEPD